LKRPRHWAVGEGFRRPCAACDFQMAFQATAEQRLLSVVQGVWMATVSVLRRPERASCSSRQKADTRRVMPRQRVATRCCPGSHDLRGHVFAAVITTALKHGMGALLRTAKAFTGAARAKSAAGWRHNKQVFCRGSPGPAGLTQPAGGTRTIPAAIHGLPIVIGLASPSSRTFNSPSQQQGHRNSDRATTLE